MPEGYVTRPADRIDFEEPGRRATADRASRLIGVDVNDGNSQQQLVLATVWQTHWNIPDDAFDDPSCWYWESPSEFPKSWSSSGQLAYLRVWHDGRCGVCGMVKPIVLDHDHRTGLARGYLCTRCNNMEAKSTKPRDEYACWRARPATEILGLRFAYRNGKVPATADLSKPLRPMFSGFFGSSWPDAPGEHFEEWPEVEETFTVLVTPDVARLIDIENAYRRACHERDIAHSALDDKKTLGTSREIAEVFVRAALAVETAADNAKRAGLDIIGSRLPSRSPSPESPLEYLAAGPDGESPAPLAYPPQSEAA